MSELQTAPAAGHNSFSKDQLRSIVERVEKLEEDRKALGDDIKDIFTEAKSSGWDVKAVRTIIRLRRQDPNERHEQETVLETYMHALGMI